jgi:GcrA cell cycle regulator
MCCGSNAERRCTAEREQALSVLWASGLSGAKIAAQLGSGATRNSVIGKAYRLGLPKRDTTCSLSRVVRRARAAKERRCPAPPSRPVSPLQALLSLANAAPPEPEIVCLNLDLLALEPLRCRWPTSHRPPHRFCGRQRVMGLSYCRHHARLAFALTAIALEPQFVPPTPSPPITPIEVVSA